MHHIRIHQYCSQRVLRSPYHFFREAPNRCRGTSPRPKSSRPPWSFTPLYAHVSKAGRYSQSRHSTSQEVHWFAGQLLVHTPITIRQTVDRARFPARPGGSQVSMEGFKGPPSSHLISSGTVSDGGGANGSRLLSMRGVTSPIAGPILVHLWR